MKKLLVLVFALIAVIGMVFAVSAAEAEKLTGLADVSKLYYANGNEIAGGGMNGGSYMHHLFDGGYGACYNNNVGSYIITDLNSKLPGGYYVTEIKIYHSNNSKFSLYYTTDGVTWKPIVENAQVTEATYAVGETALQVKYVFTTCANWVASAKEIEIYGIDPAELECLHTNLSADGWAPVPGSATCTGVGKVAQACPDCGEIQEQVSNDVLPLGHDLVTRVTTPGTSISYGSATLKCSRCPYTIDFSGEVNLTSPDYSSIGESQQFTNVLVSSIADLWGASRVENLFTGNWVDVGPFNTWVAAGEVDEDEYVMLNFQGEIDLTKVKVMVQNDSGSRLVISALNSETGEYEVVRDIVSYDSAIGGGQTLVMEVPMLGVTTSSIKIQSFSNWRNTNGYYYNRMVIGELEVYGIAKGCGLDADNHEHSYDTLVEFTVAPTCLTAGTGIFKCACNEPAVLNVEASEDYHNYVEVEGTRVNSTCTVAGSYAGKCEYCEAETTITLEFDTENGHAWTETSRTDADCTNAGAIEYACGNCDATKTEAIDALGHTYGEAVVVPSTCKDNGTSTKTCSVCGNEDVTTLETTGCTWEMGEIITEPTCGVAGSANYTCSVCGETKVDAVAATGNHTWDMENVEITVAPTCTGTGVGNYTCTVCGKVEKKTVAALGHDWVAATCTDAKTCARCQLVNGEALGHSYYIDEYYPANCSQKGYDVYVCEVCGDTYTEETDYDSNVHEADYSADMEFKDATCKEDGYWKYTCLFCGEAITEVTESSEDYHQNEQVEYVAPTCQSAGYEINKCAVCEVETRIDYDASEYAHAYDDGVEITGGYKYTCKLCGASYEEITKGTAMDPIIAVDGENTFTYYVDGDYVVYSYTVSDAGTITVTIDAGAGVYVGDNPMMGWWFVGPQTGETTYTFEATQAGEYCILIGLDTETYTLPETFSVSFAEKEYPQLNYGNNNVTIDSIGGSVEYVVDVAGNYVLTLGDNASAFIVYGPYSSEMVESGYAFTVAEGEKVKFAIGTVDFQVGTVVVSLANPDNALLNGVYTTADGSALFTFENGKLTITDTNPKMPSGNAGEYTYNYNAATGAIALDPANIPLSVANGTIVVAGRIPLNVYVPPVELEMGENVIEVTDAWNGTKVCVSVAGNYTLSAPEGTAPFIMVEDAYGASMIESYPYDFTVAEGQTVVLIVLEPTTLTLAARAEHVCEYDEVERVESTCTTAGYVTYACECGKSYTENLKLAAHTEAIIPAVPGELRNPGMTSGVECSVCKAVLVAPVQASGDFRFAAVSLSLGENISITYKVQVPDGFENVYVVFNMNGVETVVSDYEIEKSTGRYMFSFKGVRLQYMADLVTATVYAENGGVISANSYSNYSVKSYIVSQLGKNNTAELKTMLSDLLVLGEKTQIYLNYKTETLMTADVDKNIITASTYAGVPAESFVQKMTIIDESTRAVADWKSVSLTFKDAMSLQFKLAIDPSKLEGIEIKVTVPVYNGTDRVDTYTAADMTYSESENRYILFVDNVKASQYGQTVVGEIYYNGVQISRVVNYSVNSYIQKNQDNANVALRDFLRAAYLYGEAVYAYMY